VGIYPNGPDVLTLTAQNVGTGAGTPPSSTIQARYSWTEAQA